MCGINPGSPPVAPVSTGAVAGAASAQAGGPSQAPPKISKAPDTPTAPTKDAVAGASGGGPAGTAVAGVAQLGGGLNDILTKLAELLKQLTGMLAGGVTPPKGGPTQVPPMPGCDMGIPKADISNAAQGPRWGG